jgi:hypothetical protein
MQRTVSNVPDDQKEFWIEAALADGGVITREEQAADGTWTLTATFPDAPVEEEAEVEADQDASV